LPGIGNYGHVKLNNISRIYTNMVMDESNESANEDEQVKMLSTMFSKGDLVRCKVLNFTEKKLFLTIDPSQVNASLNYDNLEDDMVSVELTKKILYQSYKTLFKYR
jgi:hypothetical protein